MENIELQQCEIIVPEITKAVRVEKGFTSAGNLGFHP